MTGSRMASLGVALPENELTNRELAESLGLDETWIAERTGIKSRRIAGKDETSATLGAAAGSHALNAAGLAADDIDLIICATVTPDWRFPSTACLIQSALGSSAAAFDLNAGCSGFLFGLTQAHAIIASGAAARVLVVGCEVLSRITDYRDPKTAILFGDGAGAAVIERVEGTSAVGPFALFSDGSRPELLHVHPDTGTIHMEGLEVYRAAVAGMSDATAQVLGRAGGAPGDIDLVIAHQANGRILDAVAQRLGLPPEKMFSNIDRYGNTSAASIPIALADAQASGALADGDLVVLAAFGAGFAWGAGLVRWVPNTTTKREFTGAVAADG